MNKLHVSPEAQRDLRSIKNYIAEELGNPAAAQNVLMQIVKRIRTLLEFPELGAPLESILGIQTEYRFLVCGSYIIFYRYDEARAYVDRILYNKRDYMKILFGELSKDET